ncbi:hypothetical protein M0805_009511 [Coniferiporia weirii]|nr:hypothetical protein M0805_009511 [Coniferiporia weirii]
MKPITLYKPSPDDLQWVFTVDPSIIRSAPEEKHCKVIAFTADNIEFHTEPVPSNRILKMDDSSKFILARFSRLRFPDKPSSASAKYIQRVFESGVFLNGVQYRFYHHSSSQLRSRSCYLREAKTDEELDRRILRFGPFDKIRSVAKRSKRIALLFSTTTIDYKLDRRHTVDIPDIKTGNELFSDGCGLISRYLAMQLSKHKGIVFRDIRYTPCIFQLRYLGYKGVVMLHPLLDSEKKYQIAFRESMKKFTAEVEPEFSVIDYSTPYSFGRLNNDIVVLLSSLGITNEVLIKKQEEYFDWLSKADEDIPSAIDFLSCLGQYGLAEKALLDGLDSLLIRKEIDKLRLQEVKKFKKDDKLRVRMIIHKSRFLFGVCDPFGVLKEGEVFVQVTVGGRGVTTIAKTSVLVARNPCLHPGDCLKLQAVYHDRLKHLVDCVVFASVGRRAAPSMMSGGDLDGDRFFVCWDPDIIPTKVAESYSYPPNKEYTKNNITRQDLAKHFACYNASSLGLVATLHQKWARYAPEGAMSSQCQELNALYSQCVDGAAITVPEKLRTPPTKDEPFIVDILTEVASTFAAKFVGDNIMKARRGLTPETAEALMIDLLKSEQQYLSEFQRLNLARALAREHHLDLSKHLLHVNFGALSAQEKYELCTDPCVSVYNPHIWNSVVRSDIVSAYDLADRNLDVPLRLQRLYSSKEHGLSSFFEYLRQGVQDFTRKLLIIRTGNRFAVGIFIRGQIPWDEDPQVNDNVIVCAFLTKTSNSMSTYRPCTKGYRLYCGDNLFQLYNKQRGDSFIFLSTQRTRESETDIVASIALQKISQRVQTQIGRVNKAHVTAVEIHVVSNRDRVSQQIFDLRFSHVPTEEVLLRFAQDSSTFLVRTVQNVDWTAEPASRYRDIFLSESKAEQILATFSAMELDHFMDFAIAHRAEKELILAFERRILNPEDLHSDAVVERVEQYPSLVYALLHNYPPSDSKLHPGLGSLTYSVVRNIIRCANTFTIACLVALEKIKISIASLPLEQYLNILILASLGLHVRNTTEGVWLAQEVMFVLHEARADVRSTSATAEYIHKHALAVAIDCAEEATEKCPCDDQGQIAQQQMAPTRAKLVPVEGKLDEVMAHIRIDAENTLRLHSHVRMQMCSRPENVVAVENNVLDGKVVNCVTGELRLQLFHHLPPEYEEMEWNLYDAGSLATTDAMMTALQRLGSSASECCRFYGVITGDPYGNVLPDPESDYAISNTNLNESQVAAVNACNSPLTVIWGPPGTGKTTVVTEILRKFLYLRSEGFITRILVTASTNNAVNNVLERFIAMNNRDKMIEEDQILRFSTDTSKVSEDLKQYTVNERVGGDIYQDPKLRKEADQRVKQAIIVFTTCTSAGLGTLRNQKFDTVIIDEASQITEACALIPLVKGCSKAVIVGDHVQLRPTVKPMGKALEFDVSLFERLFTAAEHPWMARIMLNVQYRFSEQLARFPSSRFYNGQLRTGIKNSRDFLAALAQSAFPWPKDESGIVVPTVFVPCDAKEEGMGKSSKANRVQAKLVAYIISLLRTPADTDWKEIVDKIGITALSPYLQQVSELRNAIQPSGLAGVSTSTIDGFQGREDDIIILSTVRCNVSHRIGFVDDERRLNVAWTRAKMGIIIVGDMKTLSANALWKAAISACTVVDTIRPPDSKMSHR